MIFVKHGLLSVLINCFLITKLMCYVESKKPFSSQFFGYDQVRLQEVEFFKTPQGTSISVLQDIFGRRFIVKQDDRNLRYRHFSVARDKLGACIALSIGILANYVEIIPINYEFSGKRDTHFPATLHNFVPGVKAKLISEKHLSSLKSIRQYADKKRPESEWGLTKQIVESMSVHEELPMMVALDTFIANPDRNKNNYFYHTETNHFYAIDFGSSFKVNLAAYACNFIESILNGNYGNISIKEVRALAIYNNTLKKLMYFYTPYDIYVALVQFIEEGGINLQPLAPIERIKNKDLYDLIFAINEELILYKAMIQENYNSCQKLVLLIDKLLTQYNYKG